MVYQCKGLDHPRPKSFPEVFWRTSSVFSPDDFLVNPTFFFCLSYWLPFPPPPPPPPRCIALNSMFSLIDTRTSGRPEVFSAQRSLRIFPGIWLFLVSCVFFLMALPLFLKFIAECQDAIFRVTPTLNPSPFFTHLDVFPVQNKFFSLVLSFRIRLSFFV